MNQGIRRIDCAELDRLGADALLIDVREPGEFAGERLAASRNVPLSSLEASSRDLDRSKTLVLVCRSGRRAADAAAKLAALGFKDLRCLEGGLLAVSAAGRALEKGPGGVWAMERQVRMAAGSLVVLGAGLGFAVHPGFFALSAAVGAGLMFSAATDTCTMALLLSKLPWNRRAP